MITAGPEELLNRATAKILMLGRDSVTLNSIAWKMADALGLVSDSDENIEAELAELAEQLILAAAKRVINHEVEVAEMPRGTVLLCRENEVFWLPPAGSDVDAPRIWFAAGYDPTYYAWSDADVADWAPLTVLKLGA